MPEDYQTVVLAKYRKLTEKEKASIGLSSLTRASIRKACIKKFNEQYCSEDDYIFAEFFDVDRIDANFSQLLNKSDADDFKAIHNHIVGNNKTDNTDSKNTELLAWLIDFNPRPSHRYYAIEREKEQKETKASGGDVIDYTKKNIVLNPISEELVSNPNVTMHSPTVNRPKWQNKWFFGSAVGIASISVIFLFFPRYMTWRGNHYEWLFFNTSTNKTPVVAIDWDLIRGFQMVTRKDTLTEYSIGKLWYLKEKNNHEVFTMGGKHPLLVNRNLRPLSKTILDSIKSKIKVQNQMQGMMSAK